MARLATVGRQQESGDAYGLPQALADRFGWEEQVALIAQVYHRLPADEQRVACIFTENYGEAGALVQFGDRYHLPAPISGHNAFYLWGPDGCSGQVLITINISPQDAAQGYGSQTLSPWSAGAGSSLAALRLAPPNHHASSKMLVA